MTKCSIVVLFILFYQYSSAQSFFPKKNYENLSIRNPLDIPISLVGNFGECRPNHFHSGIDIRTNQKENLNVYCIADGYVSRVKIEAGGFGNAIYITHGSITSVYAHLNTFYVELDQYVRKQQYQNKSWKVDLSFLPHQFPVRKGKFIAFSGNTGSSQGPHLHLEIRDSKTEAPLNPLLFYSQLNDTKPPVLKQLAWYSGHKSIFDQKPTLLSIKNNKLAKDTVFITNRKAYFGIVGDDFMENSNGTLGIYEMRMFVDDKPYFGWQMDNISYTITRYMNAMADYKTKKNNGPWIQLCYKLPNNQLSVYKSFNNLNGMIELNSGESKKVRIEVYDTKYNKSSIQFYVASKSERAFGACQNELVAGKVETIQNNNIEAELSNDLLYDNLCVETSMSESNLPYSYTYTVHHSDIPSHSYFDLKLKPKTTIPVSLKEKIAVERLPFGKETHKKGKAAQLKNNQVVASVREFGTYQIVIDETAPLISSGLKENEVITKKTKLFFTVKDAITSVASFEAFVEGQWLRLIQKGDVFYYELDEYFPTGNHTILLKACDENNNCTSKEFKLIR